MEEHTPTFREDDGSGEENHIVTEEMLAAAVEEDASDLLPSALSLPELGSAFPSLSPRTLTAAQSFLMSSSGSQAAQALAQTQAAAGAGGVKQVRGKTPTELSLQEQAILANIQVS